MRRERIFKAVSFFCCLVLVIIMLFPFYMVVLNSFKEKIDIVKQPLSVSNLVGFSNYVEAFNLMNYFSVLKNSIIITVCSLFIIIIFSSMFAYLLARWDWKLNKVLFIIIISSMIIPFQTLMIPLVTIYGKLGVLNSLPSLVFFYLGFGLSMATFMYHGFIKGISQEIEEAAVLDGCGYFQVFWKVIFPILKPITSTILILDLLWIWNDYLLPSLVLIKESQRTIPLSTFYFFGNYTSEFGYGMAALVLSMLPILVVYISMQKHIINGVMDGAIK